MPAPIDTIITLKWNRPAHDNTIYRYIIIDIIKRMCGHSLHAAEHRYNYWVDTETGEGNLNISCRSISLAKIWKKYLEELDIDFDCYENREKDWHWDIGVYDYCVNLPPALS